VSSKIVGRSFVELQTLVDRFFPSFFFFSFVLIFQSFDFPILFVLYARRFIPLVLNKIRFTHVIPLDSLRLLATLQEALGPVALLTYLIMSSLCRPIKPLLSSKEGKIGKKCPSRS
jgi:hypothetical protein